MKPTLNDETYCLICGLPAERHHIKTRATFGSDDDYNILKVCRTHHQQSHFFGLNWMVYSYDEVKDFLLSNNWEFDETSGKWRHDEQKISRKKSNV